MTEQLPTSGGPTGEQRNPSRRNVLRTASLVALTGGGAGALAACAADGPAPAATSAAPTSAAPTSAAPTSAAPTSGPPSSTPTSSVEPAPEDLPTSKEPEVEVPDGPSLDVADVPVGGGVILKDADYVVTQPKKGQFRAFDKTCTHKGCPVSSVSDGLIRCNCHQSAFSIKDGSVVNPPAQKGLTKADVEVVGKKVYVTD